MELALIIFLVLFSIIIGITIHEIGHFTAAKIFKVNVKEFSIGIGPKLVGFKIRETRVAIRLLPIMAYVVIDSNKLINIYKEILQDEKQDWEIKKTKYIKNTLWCKYKVWIHNKNLIKYEEMISISDKTFLLEDISLWKRNIISFAGVFFNLIMFTVFILIQFYGFNVFTNPFVEIGNSFLIMFKNMVFLDTSGSTMFGEVINANNNGQIKNFNIGLIAINYFATFNLMVFIFNIIPMPPLDGYKIITDSFCKFFNININKKIETWLTIIGVAILGYIFITTIIANIRFT